MRCLLLLSAAAVAVFVGCAPEQNWRVWRTEGTTLTQLFPCKPLRQQRKAEVAGRQLQLVLQACDAGGVTWAQVHGDVVDPAAVEPTLQALMSAAHANIGAPSVVREAMNVAGETPQPTSGRYRLRGMAPGGNAIEEDILVFARGTIVVQVTALGGRLPVEAVDTFLGSMRASP